MIKCVMPGSRRNSCTLCKSVKPDVQLRDITLSACQQCSQKYSTSSDSDRSADVDNCELKDNAGGTCFINELLCFAINQIDGAMLVDTLVKLIVDFYDAGEIESAKNLLWETLRSLCSEETLLPRAPKRIGENKKSNDASDIIHIFHSAAYSNLINKPIFVAKDTSRLPPVTPEAMDISVILRNLLKLQTDVNNLRETFVSKTEMQNEVKKLSMQLSSKQNANGDTPQSEKSIGPVESRDSLPVGSSVVANQCSGQNRSTFAECVKALPAANYTDNTASSRSSKAGEKPFTLVSRARKKKRKVIMGSCNMDNSSNLNISVIQPRYEIFATRFAPEVSEEDIRSLLVEKAKLAPLSVRKIKTKFESYSSFVVACNLSDKDQFLSASVWPTGALIRPFIRGNSNKSGEAMKLSNVENNIHHG